MRVLGDYVSYVTRVWWTIFTEKYENLAHARTVYTRPFPAKGLGTRLGVVRAYGTEAKKKGLSKTRTMETTVGHAH